MTYRGDPPASTVLVRPPRHPVTQLQGPFEESMLESAYDDSDMEVFLDAVARRNTMLEAPVYTRVVAGRWKQKPGEKFHPLWKLVAQISFGVHLLAERMAKSEDDVMQILQSHVDEIDGFLERTTEDFNLARDDIEERLRCLALPLSHPATFDKMLEDRDFRLSIVEGNEKIEHIVDRTSQAMKDQLKDVQKGYDSSLSLEKYLHGLSQTWQRTTVEHEAVFVAMLGNVEGWRKAFMDLHMQGSKLGSSIRKLTEIINQMQARAGEVSRRMLHQARGYGGTRASSANHQAQSKPPGRVTPVSRYQSQPQPPAKNLPHQPDRSNSHGRMVDSSFGSGQSPISNLLHPGSASAQHAIPAPQSINATATPQLVQPHADHSARIQSVVPSLLELPSEPVERLSALSFDQKPVKSFAAVELPADVPEETLRALPISKQNRMSMGLGLLPSSKEKRLSKIQLPTTALVDLLRTNPAPKQEEVISSEPASKSWSPFGSKPGSVQRPNSTTPDDSNRQRLSLPKKQDSRTASLPVSVTPGHTKNNVRRPKKGAQHWFDALDDDSGDEKISIPGNSSPSVSTTHLVVSTSKPVSEQGSHPGTPSWAVNTFEKAERKQMQQMLRQGAFNSHPPTLPPGSPPIGENGPVMNNISGHASARASPVPTPISEPGPRSSQTSASASPVVNRHQFDARTSKRASGVAPEVVIKRKPVPQPSTKSFAVELEGSTPVNWNDRSKSFITELEAPQQHFKLPPRPIKHHSSDAVLKISASHSLPLNDDLRAQQTTVEKTEPVSENNKAIEPADGHLTPPSELDGEEKGSVDEWDVVGDYIDTETITSVNTDDKSQFMQPVHDKDVTEVSTPQVRDLPPPGEESASSTNNDGDQLQGRNIPTPQIPLPPSPRETESESKRDDGSAPQEKLFLLPAVAYKAPLRAQNPRKDSLPTPTTKVTHFPSGSPIDSPQSPNSVRRTSQRPSTAAGDFRAHKPAVVIPGSGDTNAAGRLSTEGTTNQWKAFFRGEASPVDSELSIRNLKASSFERKSPLDTQAPTFPTSVRDSGSSLLTPAGKDVLWFNKTDSSDVKSAEGPGQTEGSGTAGLGIMTVSSA